MTFSETPFQPLKTSWYCIIDSNRASYLFDFTVECKASEYADLRIALSSKAWDSSLRLRLEVEVGACCHVLKLVKDSWRSAFPWGLDPFGPQNWYCADD
jgi:hypothetical protein